MEYSFKKPAFYDFSVAPYSFDFATFLVCAKAHECDHVVFVPGEREYQKLTIAQQQSRFKFLMLPLLQGQRKISTYTICATRDEALAIWRDCGGAEGNCYPNGYAVEAPIEGHLLKHLVTNPRIIPFRANDLDMRYVDEKLAGRKPIVITIRQTMRPARNSNIAAWIEFAIYAKGKGYDVIFVPDTDHIEQDFGFESWPAAATDIHIRLGLAERALVNMGVNNGPMILPFMSNLPLLYVKPVTDAHVETTTQFWEMNKISPGSQPSWFTDNQRIVWENDDVEVLKRAFDQWIDVQNGGTWGDTPIPHITLRAAGTEQSRISNMEKALATGYPRLKSAEKTRDDTLTIVCYGPSLEDTWEQIKDSDGPVMTVSGAHDFLIGRGIVPDFHFDCDPRDHKAYFTANAHPQIHYLMATCCSPKIWENLAGCRVTLWHSLNAAADARWILRSDPDYPLFEGGSTAGLRAIEVAGAAFGFNKFRIFGMDSSCKDGELHAGPHNGKPQRRTTIRAVDGGREYVTTPQLIAAAREFLNYVSRRPIKSLKLYGDGLLQEMYYRSSKALIESLHDFTNPQLLEKDTNHVTNARI